MARLNIVLSLVTIGLLIGVVLLQQGISDLAGRLDTLEQARAVGPEPSTSGGPELAGQSPAVMDARLSARLEEVGRRLETLEKRPAASGPAPGAAGKGSGDLASAEFSDAVRRVAVDLARNDVAFRSALANPDRTKIGKDAPFARLADALELDATQDVEFRKGIQNMQAELFQLLSEPRDDGIVPMERIQEAESLGPNDVRKTQIFIELFTLRIPGSEETYMQRAGTLTSEFRKRARAMLQPRQQEMFDALEVDLFSIKFD